jgi:hypothetical protein
VAPENYWAIRTALRGQVKAQFDAEKFGFRSNRSL